MAERAPAEIATEPPPAPVIARQAGLRYVSDTKPGYSRKPAKEGFDYFKADGSQVKDEEEVRRIRKIAIPPAWTEVWISPWENGHIQATGRDARGRKQYRYHTRWREVRDEAKYERVIGFAKALPAIRKRVDEDLKRAGLPREKVLATLVHLLGATMMRIGNEEYARENKSFGLSTLRNRHVSVDGSEVEFRFRGKSGVMHRISLQDRRLAGIVKRLRDLPGQELFSYLDDDGETHTVDSSEVNDYLREITGEDYTAKDFRTWSGTLLAALALQEFERVDSQAQAKKNVVQAIEHVAQRLGNTPAVCRKCYIHPGVLEAYVDGSMLDALHARAKQEMRDGLQDLSAEEGAVLALLESRLDKDADLARQLKASIKAGKNGARKRPARKSVAREADRGAKAA